MTWPADVQVSVLSFLDKCDTNSPTPKGMKALLAKQELRTSNMGPDPSKIKPAGITCGCKGSDKIRNGDECFIVNIFTLYARGIAVDESGSWNQVNVTAGSSSNYGPSAQQPTILKWSQE